MGISWNFGDEYVPKGKERSVCGGQEFGPSDLILVTQTAGLLEENASMYHHHLDVRYFMCHSSTTSLPESTHSTYIIGKGSSEEERIAAEQPFDATQVPKDWMRQWAIHM